MLHTVSSLFITLLELKNWNGLQLVGEIFLIVFYFSEIKSIDITFEIREREEVTWTQVS